MGIPSHGPSLQLALTISLGLATKLFSLGKTCLLVSSPRPLLLATLLWLVLAFSLPRQRNLAFALFLDLPNQAGLPSLYVKDCQRNDISHLRSICSPAIEVL